MSDKRETYVFVRSINSGERKLHDVPSRELPLWIGRVCALAGDAGSAWAVTSGSDNGIDFFDALRCVCALADECSARWDAGDWSSCEWEACPHCRECHYDSADHRCGQHGTTEEASTNSTATAGDGVSDDDDCTIV
jgi:hypothetical protein